MSIKYNDNGTFKDIKVKVGDNIPVGAEFDYDGNTIPVGYEEVDNIDNFYSKVTFNDTPANAQFFKKGSVVTISFQGSNMAHAQNNILFTLPEGYRPKSNQGATPFITSLGQIGYLLIDTDGKCKLAYLSTSTTSRIIFNISFSTEI